MPSVLSEEEMDGMTTKETRKELEAKIKQRLEDSRYATMLESVSAHIDIREMYRRLRKLEMQRPQGSAGDDETDVLF